MHNETHNHHINGLLIIVSVLLVGGVLWYIISASAPAYEAPVKVAAVPEATEELYLNNEYGFSLRYDKRLVFSDDHDDMLSWRYNSTQQGIRIATLSLPHDFSPSTNLSEGVIAIGASKDAAALQSCLIAQQGEKEEVDAVPEPTFKIFSLTEAAAGNFYEVRSYRTLRNGYCVSIDRLLHSSNIDNYDPEQGITEFNRTAVEDILDRVINSFHFN